MKRKRSGSRLPFFFRLPDQSIFRKALARRENADAASEFEELYQLRLARDGRRAALGWRRRQLVHLWIRLAGEALRRKLFERNRPARPTAQSAGETMSNILTDLRLSLRALLRAPLFSLTVLLTVGLGIGGSTAVFSVVNSVLLQPLPYSQPEELVKIYTASPPSRWPFSVADYLALEEQQTSFDRVAAYNYGGMFLESGDEVERVSAMPLTWAYPELLGLQPLVGRVFEAGDGRVGAEATALISHGFWMRKMGGDPAALGRPIRLNDRAYTVIGVLPSQMGPLEHSREVFPILQFDTPSRKGPFFLHIVGRLGEDVDAAAAAAELRAINRRIFPIWESSYPDERASWGMQDLREAVVGEVGRPLAVALGAVAFVLLIASVNAANLLLARVVRQRRALAVRAALGATRFRLARQLITESGLLGMAGGILGIAVAAGLLRLVEVFGADYIPRLQEVGLQGPSWGFAVVVTAASSLLFGLVPALEGSRPGLERDLGSQGRANTEGARPRRLRKALVALEFAVAVPLLVGAGLMLASFSNLAAVDPGFRTENILTVGVEFRMSRYPRMSDVRAFWDEALPRLAALPGVGAAGLANGRPPNQYPMSNNFNLLDRPTPPTESQPAVPWVAINPEYFQVLGVPLLQGRMLRETAEDADIEVMVDNTWARRFYPGEDPLGRRFTSGGCDGPECSRLVVVGVVGDVKYAGLGDSSQGTVYTLQRLNPTNWTYLFARTERDPDLVLPSIREVLRARDAQLPLFSVSTIDDLMAENLQSPLHASALAGALAVVALLLAATGIYGVMAYFVQQRTAEIGIRIALGGQPSSVLWMVVGQGMRLALWGLAIGMPAAFLLSPLLSGLLFEIAATDLLTYASVALGLTAVALFACLVPGLRASAVDPVKALQSD